MRIELSNAVAPAKSSVCCNLADEIVVLDLSSGVYFGLQGVGPAMWQFIQQPRTVQEVVDHLMSEYDVSREDCIAKTIEFLEELADHRLIAITGDAAA